jgi:hypothetical protein
MKADSLLRDSTVETVGGMEELLGVPPGTFRNADGRDTRSDKKLETIRKEWRRRQRAAKRRRFVQEKLFAY